MEVLVLKQLLELSCLKDRFWVVFDWLKRELFTYLKEKITKIDWVGNYLEQLDEIHEGLVQEWKQAESVIRNSDIPVERLEGVLYEVLFYFSCIYTVSIFKGSWIMEVAGTPLVPEQRPPWFEVIPIYDIQPKLFRIREGNKWILKVPQIEADFLICYWDTETGYLPLAFIDVKSSVRAVRNLGRKQRVWFALGCKFFHDSIFQIAYPRRTPYPKDLNDWIIKQVCWRCGALNKGRIFCGECGEKIWLAKDEFWKPWPFK